VRRAALAALAALAFAGPAHAAGVTATPGTFSPRHSTTRVAATVDVTERVGLRLATRGGRSLGWLVRPERTRALSLNWDGGLNGKRVADGTYVVELVYRSTVLANSWVQVDSTAPHLVGLRVDDGAAPYAGDTRLLTTISPNGDGFRDTANVRFTLREPATVVMEVTRTVKKPVVIWHQTFALKAGPQVLTWAPDKLNPRTYLIRLYTVDRFRNALSYGSPNAFVGRHPRGPVVRVQGIDAGFGRPSYAPGQLARIHVATDAPALTMRVFHAGPEQVVTYADNQLAGVEIDQAPVQVDMSRYRNRPRSVLFRVPDVPSGFYYVQLGSADGRIGYAPFVVHPTQLGATGRVLVVLPTNTWQAYNFQDVNGNGYGDTWYAGPPNLTVDLSRTYIARGVPPRFYRYDLPFLHWLYWSGKSAEFISDSDFDQIASGDELAKAYDLIVFEGHEEYVTSHEYDVVQRFRDLGGNLMFLSADNFYWKVRKTGQVLRKLGSFRTLGRPEAALIGAEYRANDDGQHQGLFVVENSASAPWLWDGTGLADGSTFGQFVGGYGIEIDATTPQSPPGTLVLAQIPDLFGPGLTAQMTYYETTAGAKVFAAGALDFGGSATFWPVKRMLDNVWARLSAP
jgi:hypothetical protein